MKKLLLMIMLCATGALFSQQNPTLGIGLEALTFNKGSIDVEVLTKVIMKKQRELKDEALKRFMLKMFPNSNYTTKFYVQNCLNILLNEKNPQVIEKEILELTTNYAIALGVTQAVDQVGIFNTIIEKKNNYINYEKIKKEINHKNKLDYFQSEINILLKKNELFKKESESYNKIQKEVKQRLNLLKDITLDFDKINGMYNEFPIKDYKLKNSRENDKTKELIESIDNKLKQVKKDKNINDFQSSSIKLLKNLSYYSKQNLNKEIEKIEFIEKRISKAKRQLARNGVKYDLSTIKENDLIITDLQKLTFGEKLDIVSLALSENSLLRKKGFFKNKIDYRLDQGYLISEETDTKLIETIENKINPYIENYDIIKNFLQNVKKQDGKNSIETLNELYLNQLELDEDFEKLVNDNLFKNDFKGELYKFKNLLKLKSDYSKLVGISKILNKEDNKKDVTFKHDKIEKVLLNDSLTYNTILEKVNNYYNSSIKKIQYLNLFFELNAIAVEIINNPTFKDYNISFPYKPSLIDFEVINEKQLKTKVDDAKQTIESIKNNNDIESINSIINKVNTSFEEIDNKIISIKEAKKNTDNKNKISNVAFLLKSSSEIEKIDTLNISNLVDSEVKNLQKKISNTPIFFEVFINNLLKKLDGTTVTITVDATKTNDSNKQLSDLFTKIYERLNYFKNSTNYNISDIDYLEKELVPQLVGLKFTNTAQNQGFYNDLIKGLKNLTPLLKIRILLIKNLNIDMTNYEDLVSLFEFVGNLDKLDKAQTYASIIDLIQKNSDKITDLLNDGEFKDSYKIFINGVKKYTLINPSAEKQYVEIDVVSFLDDLQDYYNRKNPSKFSLYLSIGLNQNMFIDKFNFPDNSEQISAIGFASEKIGVKYKIHDFKKFKGYENVIKSDVYLNQRAPFINEWFVSLYGSGLLYSLANTTTNQNFNFSHIGLSTGFRFYNALDFNIMLGLPFVKNQPFGNNGFIGIGFDVPLGEYLEALGNK